MKCKKHLNSGVINETKNRKLECVAKKRGLMSQWYPVIVMNEIWKHHFSCWFFKFYLKFSFLRYTN